MADAIPSTPDPPKVCRPVALPPDEWLAAAKTAVEQNPANRPAVELFGTAMRAVTGVATEFTPQHIAVLTSKYWGNKGVNLAVHFLDTTAVELQDRILTHMNAWGTRCNVKFTKSTSPTAQVRIARQPGDGYWSYLGTDCLHIPAGQPTINLDSFSMSTPETEYRRVVRHETGHTLGCPHEHARPDLVNLLDPARTIAFFRDAYGWTEQMTREQVLTPLSESQLLGTAHADADSVMSYQFPGSCTKSGNPIVGGSDITEDDYAMMGKLYPQPVAPPPPPVSAGVTFPLSVLNTVLANAGYRLTKL